LDEGGESEKSPPSEKEDIILKVKGAKVKISSTFPERGGRGRGTVSQKGKTIHYFFTGGKDGKKSLSS